jgi:hypothetical protein
MKTGRRTWLAFMLSGATLLVAGGARADASVPHQLQAQLVAKLASFDRNFPARAAGTARILVLRKGGDAESARVADNLARALVAVRQVGGVPTQVDVEPFAGAAALADRCRAGKVAIVFFSTGLEGEMGAAGAALSGADILTVGTTASDATRGAVVAFDLEEGRAKIVVNLARAKAQNVSFKAELLKLSRIVG